MSEKQKNNIRQGKVERLQFPNGRLIRVVSVFPQQGNTINLRYGTRSYQRVAFTDALTLFFDDALPPSDKAEIFTL